MACVPPFCMGTGSWCGCNCECCPPMPCYTSWTYEYECGTGSTEWYTGDGPNQGCLCTPLPFRAPTVPIEFPDFNYNLVKDDESGFVFAQAGAPGSDPACVIPCALYSITLTTTGCCLFGSGFSFIAIGAGTVSLTPCPSTPCGAFICDINGAGSTTTVANCEPVTIAITPPSTNCCECCLVKSSGTLLSYVATPAFTTQRNVETGLKRTFINRQALINRIRGIRR